MINFTPRLDWKNKDEGEPETIVYKEDLLRYETALKALADESNTGRLSEDRLGGLTNTRATREGALTIFLGDSITQNLNTLTDPNQPLLGESFATLVSMMSGQRILYARNAGVTNNTVQDAAARLYKDVIAYRPDRCVVLLGTNNTNQALPTISDTMIAYERDIIEPLLSAGIEPIVCTVPPRNGVRTTEPATYRRQARWNAFIRSVAAKHRLLMVDIHALMVDPATGDYKAGFTGDGVHPNKAGYKEMSNGFVNFSIYKYMNVPSAPLERDRYSIVSLAPNPLFLEGLGGSGNVLPTGWTGSTTGITVSFDDAYDGDPNSAGKWFNIEKTDAATTKNVNWVKSLASLATAGNPVAVGDRIAWGFKYKLTAGTDATTYLTVALRYTDSGGANVKIVTPMNQFQMETDGAVYYESVVPAGCANLRFDVSFSTASLQTFSISQMTARNLTGMGVAPLTRP